MENDKKEIRQAMETLEPIQAKNKLLHRDVDFLTEVLACIAWTTKG